MQFMTKGRGSSRKVIPIRPVYKVSISLDRLSMYNAYSPKELVKRAKGVWISDKYDGNTIDNHMINDLDLYNHKDYEYITNETLYGKLVGVLIILTDKGMSRFIDTRKFKDFDKTSIKSLDKQGYKLFK